MRASKMYHVCNLHVNFVRPLLFLEICHTYIKYLIQILEWIWTQIVDHNCKLKITLNSTYVYSLSPRSRPKSRGPHKAHQRRRQWLGKNSCPPQNTTSPHSCPRDRRWETTNHPGRSRPDREQNQTVGHGFQEPRYKPNTFIFASPTASLNISC